ncbi:MAG: flagellar basal body-associated FliL family protein [Chloroflexi bacterium]|nr:flagellar basal body-associated FliL family protein [Chloroflexota bacterium]
MSKIKAILKILFRVITFLSSLIVIGVSLASAYIIFAPDDLPKPFYLQYIYPTPIPTGDGAAPIAVTPSPTPQPDIRPGDGIMVNSGTKIINLADPTGRKYIRVTVVIEFAPTNGNYTQMTPEEKAAYTTAFNAEITAKMPMIDDTIITLLSTKTFDELYTAQGKEDVRKDILDQVNVRLPEYRVISVYFTEFVVQ